MQSFQGPERLVASPGFLFALHSTTAQILKIESLMSVYD